MRIDSNATNTRGGMCRALRIAASVLLGLATLNTAKANAVATANPTTGTYASSIFWMDWTGYTDATAEAAAGQNFTFNLTDGSTLKLNVQRSGNSTATFQAQPAPTYSGSAVGNAGYCFPTCGSTTGSPNVVLYSTSSMADGTGNPTTATFTLSTITLTNPAGVNVTNFEIAMADGESTDTGDGTGANFTFTTNGGNWQLLERVPATGRAAVTLTGVGTQTVGQPSGTQPVPSWVLVTSNPSTGALSTSASTTSKSKQGVMLGIRLGSVTLNKNIVSRVNAADQFVYAINNAKGVSVGQGTGSCATVGNCTTTGTSTGLQIAISAPIANGNTVTLTEAMAAGSSSSLAAYEKTIICANSNTGSATVLPGNGSTIPYNPASPPTITPQSDADNITCTISNSAWDVTLSKSAPAAAQVGTPYNYTINLGNSGTAAVVSGTALTVAEAVPAGITINSVTAGASTSSVACGTLPVSGPVTLTCTVTLSAALAAGAANGAASFTLNATATAAGSTTNYASVDPTTGTNPPTPGATCAPASSCGSATTAVAAAVNVSITKTDNLGGKYSPGGTGIYTLTVSNNGPSAITAAAVADALPNGVTLSGVWTCSSATACHGCTVNGSVCTGGTIGAGNGTNVLNGLTVDLAAGATMTVTLPVTFSANQSAY